MVLYPLDKVKSNYHKLTLIHHPDKGGDNDFYCNLGDAYKFLIRYIESGHEKVTDSKADSEFHDLFKNFKENGRPKCNYTDCINKCDSIFDKYCKQHDKIRKTSDKQCTKMLFDKKLNCERQCKCKCIIDKDFCTQHVKP